MITGHGGNVKALAERLGCSINEITDMSSNLNPLGPPEGLEAHLCSRIGKIRALPQADARDIVLAFSNYHQVDSDRIMVGNGTTWFIYTLPQALKPNHALVCGPTYSDYLDACALHKIKTSNLIAEPGSDFKPDLDLLSDRLRNDSPRIDMVFLCNPNNPTGALVPASKIRTLLTRYPETFFVIDESYLPFVADAENISQVTESRFANLIVLSSMSKIYRIPGLRTGFVTAHPAVIRELAKGYQPWSVNALAQEAALYLMDPANDLKPFLQKTRTFIQQEKTRFLDRLNGLRGLKTYPSVTYYVLAELKNRMTSQSFCSLISDHKMLIRDCSNFEGLTDKFIRFSLKEPDINSKLAEIIVSIQADNQ